MSSPSSSISFSVEPSGNSREPSVRSRTNSVFTDNSSTIRDTDSFTSDVSSIVSESGLARIKKKRSIFGTIKRIVRKDKSKRADEISNMQKDIITEMIAYTYSPAHKNALPVWNQRLHPEAFYTSRLLNFPELSKLSQKPDSKIYKEGTFLFTSLTTDNFTQISKPSIVLGTSANSDYEFRALDYNIDISVDTGLEDIFANFRLSDQ
ncbi:4345_t:CDS:2, partial [Ambispora leptoticha]